jgi:hypothetical protein
MGQEAASEEDDDGVRPPAWSGRIRRVRGQKEHPMSLQEIVIAGTLKPDGTLDLDQKPNLAPGRVTVVLRQESEAAPPREDWWQFMQRTRRELEAAGSRFMNEEEVSAHIEWLREGDRMDDLLGKVDEKSRKYEQS